MNTQARVAESLQAAAFGAALLAIVGGFPPALPLLGALTATAWMISNDEGRRERVAGLSLPLLAVVAAECVSWYASRYEPNSAAAVSRTLHGIAVLVVAAAIGRDRLGTFYRAAVAAGGVLAALAVVSFARTYLLFGIAGFRDMSPFRYLFTAPFTGGPVAEGATVFVALLAPAAWTAATATSRAGRAFGWSVYTLLHVVLLLALSKGLVLAALAFVVVVVALASSGESRRAWWARARPHLAALAIALVVVGAWSPHSMRTLLRPWTSESQVRSANGRIDVWRSVLARYGEVPPAGVGPGNFAFFYSSSGVQHPGQRFVGRAFNGALQIYVERGVLGVLAFLWLLAAILRAGLIAWRREPEARPRTALLLAGLLALAVRDVTYSSILQNALVIVLAALTAGGLAASAGWPRRRQWRAASAYAVLGLLATAIAFSSVQEQRRAAADALARQAARLIEAEDYESAITLLADASRLVPDSVEYLSLQALALARSASEDWNLNRPPRGPDAPIVNTLADALALYEAAIARSPDDDAFRLNRGYVLAQMGRRDDALTSFGEAVRLAPNVAENRVALAAMMDSLGRRGEARRQYVHALRVQPGLIHSAWMAEWERTRPAEHRQLLEEYLHAVSGSPDLSDRAGVGQALLRLGRLNEAEVIFLDLTRAMPQWSRPWLSLAAIHMSRGDTSQAAECGDRALVLDPTDAAVLTLRGLLHEQRGAIPVALRYYERAASHRGSAVSAHATRVGRLYGVRAAMPNDLVPASLLGQLSTPADVDYLCDRIVTLGGDASRAGCAVASQ